MKGPLLVVSLGGILALTSPAAAFTKPEAPTGAEAAAHVTVPARAIPEPLAVAGGRSHYRCPRGWRRRGSRCYRRGRSRRAKCRRGYYGRRCSKKRKSTSQPAPPAPQPPAAPAPAPPAKSLADHAYQFAVDDTKSRSTITSQPDVAETTDWQIEYRNIYSCYESNGIGQCGIYLRAWRLICNMNTDPFCISQSLWALERAWFHMYVDAVPMVIGIVSRVPNPPNGVVHEWICSNDPWKYSWTQRCLA